MLSRCFTRQHVFELAENLPEAKRKPALALMVRKWSSFPSTQFAAQWAGNKASVYAWDGQRIGEAIRAAGLNPLDCAVWPETFVREPMADGFRLAVMSDGLEGQVWKQGLLSATRWWSEIPSPRDWIIFLRGSGVDITQGVAAVPTPVDAPLLPTPWTIGNTAVTDVWSLIRNDRAAAIAAAVTIAPFLYLVAQAATIGVATIRTEHAVAELAEASSAVRSDRSAALTFLDAIDSYLSLEQFPPQFDIIATVNTLLRGQRAAIVEWTYDAGNLDLLLQTELPADTTHFIELFERDDLFSGVSGTIAGQSKDLRLKMTVAPQTWPTS